LLSQAGAASARRNGLACRTHRGLRPERTVTRDPPGTREVCKPPTPCIGPGAPNRKHQGSHGVRLPARERNPRRSAGITWRQQQAGETGCRSRSVLTVPDGRRTGPAGSRLGGRRAPGHPPLEGNTARASNLVPVCTRCQRIAEPATPASSWSFAASPRRWSAVRVRDGLSVRQHLDDRRSRMP
jgi:hypothetical protein